MTVTPSQKSNTLRQVDPDRLLYSLMVPAVIMPLMSWMFSVALPTIRDNFAIPPDVAAWIATAFTLPFMILMPVYGRLSDSLGKRRLIITGIIIFSIGSLIAIFSHTLSILMLGRAIQGLGAASLLPLSLALISEVFPEAERGKAMGSFSTIGPATGVIGPVLAGFIVATWGWRAAFVPATGFAVISLLVVYFMIPSSNQRIELSFLSTFDWLGVGLLSLTLTAFLFYLSSRPITGRPPLQDWRLALLTLIFLFAFVRYEKNKKRPFINLNILKYGSLAIGSICACIRMLLLSGSMGFLMPLYLADIFQIEPQLSGFFLMANPAAMILFVRLGGAIADRWGSRLIVMTGFSIVTVVMIILSQLSTELPQWTLILVFILFGIGAGLMLASLHRAALHHIPDDDMGTASGIYSMIRFIGSALGAAVGGILLQNYLSFDGLNELSAYQAVFRWFIGFAILGFITASFLPKTNDA